MRFVGVTTWISVILLQGCVENKMELSDFSSDGCSFFVNGTFESPELWKDCCLQHDIAYWRGGTELERETADLALKACVEKKTGNPKLAEIMYQAVRTGGEPHFPTSYRWGYGWPIGRGYKRLSLEEDEIVQEKLKDYWQKVR